MKKKILVTGPALTTSGYGEQARFALRSLRSREDLFDIYLAATTWGHCGWIHDDNEERAWLDSLITKNIQYTQASNGQPQYDMSLQISMGHPPLLARGPHRGRPARPCAHRGPRHDRGAAITPRQASGFAAGYTRDGQAR